MLLGVAKQKTGVCFEDNFQVVVDLINKGIQSSHVLALTNVNDLTLSSSKCNCE
jgi:hypothetical protein